MEPGFWMRDHMLGLWLRLFALHLPEPVPNGEFQATITIRNHWLLASHIYFGGCTPHCMEEACETAEGRTVVRIAVDSLLAALQKSSAPLDQNTLHLLGIKDGLFTKSLERKWLIEIGHAFIDLLDEKLTCDATSTEVMPGSIPYRRT